jgi:hypothetical protein
VLLSSRGGEAATPGEIRPTKRKALLQLCFHDVYYTRNVYFVTSGAEFRFIITPLDLVRSGFRTSDLTSA